MCFMHAYRNAEHERAGKQILERDCPGMPISVSSEVAPEIREYQRASTTCANAYVQPGSRTTRTAARQAAGGRLHDKLYIMLSNGGITTVRAARRFPDPADRVGSGGGSDGGRATTACSRHGQPDLVRHGRHHREDVPRRARMAEPRARVRGRPRAALSQGLGAAAQGAGRRHDRDRRRRRLDRARGPDGSAQGGPRERRLRSRPRRLRARRDQTHRHRRRPRAGLSLTRLFPRRRDDARSRTGRARDRGARRPPAREERGASRGRHPRRGEREHGRGDPHARGGEGPGPAPLHADRLRRRWPRPRLRPRAPPQDPPRDLPVRRRRHVRPRDAGGRPLHGPGQELRVAARPHRLGSSECDCSPRWRPKPGPAGRSGRRSGRGRAPAEPPTCATSARASR